jgi:hypothetical protein
MDGTVGFVEGSFELAIGAWGFGGLMVKEAVGERAAELLMKKGSIASSVGQKDWFVAWVSSKRGRQYLP